jgi:hypothetical protein
MLIQAFPNAWNALRQPWLENVPQESKESKKVKDILVTEAYPSQESPVNYIV